MNLFRRIISRFTRPAPAPSPLTHQPDKPRRKPKLELPRIHHGGNRVGRPNKLGAMYAGEKLYLEQLDTTRDGGYDKAGAYWGLPTSTGCRVWCAWMGPANANANDYPYVPSIRIYVWAKDRTEAKNYVTKHLPTARFYR